MTNSARFLAGGLVAALALAVTPAGATESPDDSAAQTERYLVRYAGDTDMREEAAELREDGVAVSQTFSHAVHAAVVSATSDEAAALARSADVLAVEPDAPVRISGTQASPPWGLDRIDQRSRALSASFSSATQGSGVDVYVVDTGVLRTHTEFTGRVATGWTGINDGYGTRDCNGHGTHVAGTAAGTVSGVAKKARIIPVRVLDCSGGGRTSGIIAGLNWITQNHAAGVPAVVNLSLGGPVSSTMDAALRAVIADGVVAVVAAGNERADACNVSPARVPAALTIAATNRYDRQAWFSNRGRCVDMFAPGVEIRSAWRLSNTSFNYLDGTSMAAPHVAGAAALLLSRPGAPTAVSVTAQLVTTATPGVVGDLSYATPNRLLFVDPLAGLVPQNAVKVPTSDTPLPPLVEQPTVPAPTPTLTPAPTPKPVLTAPGPAQRVAGRALRRAARVTWTPGASSGSALVSQTVRVYVGNRLVRSIRVGAATRLLTVRSLRPTLRYRFAVVARNGVGNGRESARSLAVRPRR